MRGVPRVRPHDHGESRNEDIFNDVLSFQRRRQESLPCRVREDDERQGRHRKMRRDQEERHALHAPEEEQKPDRHLKNRKRAVERLERDKRNRPRMELQHQRSCGAQVKGFERAKPEIHDKERQPRQRNFYVSETPPYARVKLFNQSPHTKADGENRTHDLLLH